MNYTILYYDQSVKTDINALPMGLRVRYAVLTKRMVDFRRTAQQSPW